MGRLTSTVGITWLVCVQHQALLLAEASGAWSEHQDTCPLGEECERRGCIEGERLSQVMDEASDGLIDAAETSHRVGYAAELERYVRAGGSSLGVATENRHRQYPGDYAVVDAFRDAASGGMEGNG